MSVLQELADRDDVYKDIHIHQDYADVRGAVITQDIYVCIARTPTTYDLQTMRQFRDSFDGFEITRDYAVCGSHLWFGELERNECSRASIAELRKRGIELRGSHDLDELIERRLDQRYLVRVMPCRRLLGRHKPGNYRPPRRSGNHPIDRFIVRCVVH